MNVVVGLRHFGKKETTEPVELVYLKIVGS